MDAAGAVEAIGRYAAWDHGPHVVGARHGDLQRTCAGALNADHDIDVGYAFNRVVDGAEHDGLTDTLREIVARRGTEF